MQTIVIDYPPIFDRISQKFNLRNKQVIYSWGDIIYNPQDIDIPLSILVHEQVHGERQIKDVLGWWEQYLDNKSFRLKEEILAHKAEYEYLCKGQNRQHHRRFLSETSSRLSAPLYGKMISKKAAKNLLKEATK